MERIYFQANYYALNQEHVQFHVQQQLLNLLVVLLLLEVLKSMSHHRQNEHHLQKCRHQVAERKHVLKLHLHHQKETRLHDCQYPKVLLYQHY